MQTALRFYSTGIVKPIMVVMPIFSKLPLAMVYSNGAKCQNSRVACCWKCLHLTFRKTEFFGWKFGIGADSFSGELWRIVVGSDGNRSFSFASGSGVIAVLTWFIECGLIDTPRTRCSKPDQWQGKPRPIRWSFCQTKFLQSVAQLVGLTLDLFCAFEWSCSFVLVQVRWQQHSGDR